MSNANKSDERRTLESGHHLGRREFTVASAMAILSGVAITISGCGNSYSSTPSSPSPTPSPNPSGQDRVGTISANHGHQAVITNAQLTAGGEIDLDITGSADHSHTVRLTANDLDQIEAGQRVSKDTTTNSGHAHIVTFN